MKGTFVDFVRESTSISVEFELSVFKFGKEIGMLYGLISHTKILGKFIIIHNIVLLMMSYANHQKLHIVFQAIFSHMSNKNIETYLISSFSAAEVNVRNPFKKAGKMVNQLRKIMCCCIFMNEVLKAITTSTPP